MSAVVSIVSNQIQNMISFFNISSSYFRKRNPIMATISNSIGSIYNFLSLGKRLKMLQYQVQLMHYRMRQMEKLIEENNPSNIIGGSSLNKYR